MPPGRLKHCRSSSTSLARCSARPGTRDSCASTRDARRVEGVRSRPSEHDRFTRLAHDRLAALAKRRARGSSRSLLFESRACESKACESRARTSEARRTARTRSKCRARDRRNAEACCRREAAAPESRGNGDSEWTERGYPSFENKSCGLQTSVERTEGRCLDRPTRFETHDLAKPDLIGRDARDDENGESEDGIGQGHARSTRAKSSRAGKALTAKRIAVGTTEDAGVTSCLAKARRAVALGGEEASRDVAQKRASGTRQRLRFCEPSRGSERGALHRDNKRQRQRSSGEQANQKVPGPIRRL